MKTMVVVLLMLLAVSSVVIAQSTEDVCHVYVIDGAKARRALDNFRATGDEEADARAFAKASSVGVTVFPEFRTHFAEEQLTTKHYPFPGSRLVITASVYYTDESMASSRYGNIEINDQSMIVGVSVSNKAQKSALSSSTLNGAVTEVTYDVYTNKVRAKQYLRVRGRNYLIGIECDCMAKHKAN
jgi:hypothetical protein